jgi:hypothetical protein
MSDNGAPPPATMELITDALKRLKASDGIDRGKLKMWELEDLEDELQRRNHPRSVNEEFYAGNFASYRFLRGLMWLWLRREHRQLAFDDFREIDLDTLIEHLGGQDDDEGEDDGGLGPSSASNAPTNDRPPPKTSPASATSGG